MSAFAKLYQQPKSRKIAIILALFSTIIPLPVAGFHKFYLGQPLWGGIYLLLWNTPIPRIACAIDAVWYFVLGEISFSERFNGELPTGLNSATIQHPSPSLSVNAIADAVRELDRLRAEGLVSEYEFEQKRHQLLDRIA